MNTNYRMGLRTVRAKGLCLATKQHTIFMGIFLFIIGVLNSVPAYTYRNFSMIRPWGRPIGRATLGYILLLIGKSTVEMTWKENSWSAEWSSEGGFQQQIFR